MYNATTRKRLFKDTFGNFWKIQHSNDIKGQSNWYNSSNKNL